MTSDYDPDTPIVAVPVVPAALRTTFCVFCAVGGMVWCHQHGGPHNADTCDPFDDGDECDPADHRALFYLALGQDTP